MKFTHNLTNLLAAKSDAGQFSGVVHLEREGEMLFSGAYGYASRPWRIKNRPETRFRIASISKLFTAVAILQLIEAGRLGLETGVVDCLDLTETTIPGDVAVEHLLTMTAGIADWFDESGDWAENWAALCREHPLYLLRRNADYLPLFVAGEPVAAVGERHQYNGASYILLGLIIEKISGLDYFDYIRRHIFAPAGMTRSDFLALDGVDENVAEGYIPLTGTDGAAGWKKNIYAATPEAAGDGGASSTVEDLARFFQALREERLLSPAMTEAMLTPKVLQRRDRPRSYIWQYGYGVMFISNDAGQIVRYGHTGEEEGVSCRLYYYPHQRLDVVILGNQSGCAGALGWEIHDLILENTTADR